MDSYHLHLQLIQEKTFGIYFEEDISFILSLFSNQPYVSNYEENHQVITAQENLDPLNDSHFSFPLGVMKSKF